MSVLEAMAYRRPVLVSKAGDLQTLIQDGQNGFLIRKRKASALAEQMCTIFKRKDLGKVGRKARQTALSFDIQEVVHRYETLYHQLIKERASR